MFPDGKIYHTRKSAIIHSESIYYPHFHHSILQKSGQSLVSFRKFAIPEAGKSAAPNIKLHNYAKQAAIEFDRISYG